MKNSEHGSWAATFTVHEVESLAPSDHIVI